MSYNVSGERKGGSVDDIVAQTKLNKDQAETIVRFHGLKG